MPAINHDHYDDALLRDILAQVRTIAVVGASANPTRPSFGVMQFLRRQGYAVFGINPALGPSAIPGIPCVPTLADVPDPIDMVDVFRRLDSIPGVLASALALSPRPAVFWTQLGLRDDAVAAQAEAAGLRVVMNRCPAIVIPRLAR